MWVSTNLSWRSIGFVQMTVLVIGASGFVGRALLERNPDFVGCDKHPINKGVIKLDVNNIEALQATLTKFKVQSIVILAGVQYLDNIKKNDRYEYFLNGNTRMCQNIKQGIENSSVKKIVFLSTDMVYGTPHSSPVDETHICNPWGPYGKSKIECENILLNDVQCEVSVFRPRLILGEGRVGTIAKLASVVNKKLPVPIIGNGNNSYQFVGVNDVCRAIELSLQIYSPGIFNLGSNHPPKIKDLLPEVLREIGHTGIIIPLPSKAAKNLLRFLDHVGISPLVPEQFEIADSNYVLNTSKAKKILNWQATESDKELLIKSLKDILLA
jgi:dTDP-glucose 4,6-dehydratase